MFEAPSLNAAITGPMTCQVREPSGWKSKMALPPASAIVVAPVPVLVRRNLRAPVAIWRLGEPSGYSSMVLTRTSSTVGSACTAKAQYRPAGRSNGADGSGTQGRLTIFRLVGPESVLAL